MRHKRRLPRALPGPGWVEYPFFPRISSWMPGRGVRAHGDFYEPLFLSPSWVPSSIKAKLLALYFQIVLDILVSFHLYRNFGIVSFTKMSAGICFETALNL